jgi:hypothetical protein
VSRRALDRWDWACAVAPGRLTGAQRAVLQVIARHAGADGGNSFAGQDAMAESAGITDRGVRKVLRRLETMGLLVGERRPGKTTVWSLAFDWTPELQFQGQTSEPRNSGAGVENADPGTQGPGSTDPDPGTTPELPRNPSSDEGEGEGELLSFSANGSSGRGEGEREVEFNPRDLVALRRLP